MHHTASCGAGHSQSARRFPRFVTKSGLIRTFRQQNPASTEFLVLNPLKLRNSIPPCQICTPRRTLGLVFPEERRYVVRSGSERINGRLKDEFGGRHVRVRGYDKVLAHLMFGMTVLTASQLMRLIVPPI